MQESNVPPQQTGLVSRRRLFRLGVGAATFPVLGALLNACGGSSGGSAASTPAASTAGAGAGAAASGGTIKVGIMHSLSGVMSISEKAVVDAEQLAIAEINAAGGVMGKMIDAQSIVVATAATGQVGNEGKILRAVMRHSIFLAAIVGLIVMLFAYVISHAIPHGLNFVK